MAEEIVQDANPFPLLPHEQGTSQSAQTLDYILVNWIGIAGLLTIVLVVLKATGLIDWSWWWVFSPLWIGGLIVLIIVLSVILVAVVEVYKSNEKIKKR